MLSKHWWPTCYYENTGYFEGLLLSKVYMHWKQKTKNQVSISILICVTGLYLKFLNILCESFYLHWGRNYAFVSPF